MGFSLDNIIDDTTSFEAPDHAFIGSISGMVQNFPWERFERFFEVRPLINASAPDQVFLLRVLAIQELLCMDDEAVLKWLKNQMFLLSYLSPGLKPKVPTQALLNSFREKLQDANILEPFRLRCHNIILKKNQQNVGANDMANYTADTISPSIDLVSKGPRQAFINAKKAFPDIQIEDKWVICPVCESSALSKVPSGNGLTQTPQACCDRCGHEFNV